MESHLFMAWGGFLLDFYHTTLSQNNHFTYYFTIKPVHFAVILDGTQLSLSHYYQPQLQTYPLHPLPLPLYSGFHQHQHPPTSTTTQSKIIVLPKPNVFQYKMDTLCAIIIHFWMLNAINIHHSIKKVSIHQLSSALQKVLLWHF